MHAHFMHQFLWHINQPIAFEVWDLCKFHAGGPTRSTSRRSPNLRIRGPMQRQRQHQRCSRSGKLTQMRLLRSSRHSQSAGHPKRPSRLESCFIRGGVFASDVLVLYSSINLRYILSKKDQLCCISWLFACFVCFCFEMVGFEMMRMAFQHARGLLGFRLQRWSRNQMSNPAWIIIKIELCGALYWKKGSGCFRSKPKFKPTVEPIYMVFKQSLHEAHHF